MRPWKRAVVALVIGISIRGAGGPVAASDVTPSPAPARPTAASLEGSRPDIVLLVIDDMGDIDDRVYERLPTFRRLFLEQSVRFTDFIGNDPLCCPSRASILTGLTVHHHGVSINYGPLFDDRVTLATELQAESYATLYVGKYLNLTSAIPDKYPPGWTHASVDGGSYWGQARWVDGVQVAGSTAVEDYSTDVMHRQALEWIAGVPRDQPLFLYLAPFAVHGGYNRYGVLNSQLPAVAPRHSGDPRCAGVAPWRPPGYDEVDITDKPAYIADRKGMPWDDGHPLWAACEALLSVDEALADVESALAAQGRTNVLTILTSDNGMTFGAHRIRAKQSPYAVDVPFFVHWPAALGTVPRIVDELAGNIDLAPTICALAGCTMGPFANGRPAADGVSLLPLLTGEADRLARVALPIQSLESDWMPAWAGIRTSAGFPGGRQLYVEYETGEREHYTLANDPWLLENDAADPDVAPLIHLLDLESDAFFADDHAPYGYDPRR